jgi:capsular polysaccharide biosynthesis protein
MLPPNSCNQSSVSSLNCDFIQRHANGSFTESSCRPCRQRHLHAAVLLLQPSSHAYFHFMFETLPRLQFALQWMKRHKNSSILVDAWHGNTWSAQALGLLGFGDKVVVRQAHVRHSVGIAFIPPAPPIHHTFPAELNATVQRLLVAADAAAGIDIDRHSGSVLFIQRASSDSQHSAIHSQQCPHGVRMREVLNMKEVEMALRSRFGSRLLIFSSHGLHLTQQIKAFRNASMVIGVHGRFTSRDHAAMTNKVTQCAGAGLVNTMFCQQGTPVIEIIPQARCVSFFLLRILFFCRANTLSAAYVDYASHPAIPSRGLRHETAAPVICSGVQQRGASGSLLLRLHAARCCCSGQPRPLSSIAFS